MNELEELYQSILLEHNKRPQNFRALADADAHAEGHNPLCGDEVEVFVQYEGDKLVEVTFQGEGCAISRASASLMTIRLKGQDKAAVGPALARLQELLKADGPTPDLATDGDLAALAGVRKFPARVKCATLAWHTLQAAIQSDGGATRVSTEDKG